MRFEVLLAFLPAAIAAPVLTPLVGTVIPDRYIIKLKESELSAAVNTVLSLLPKPAAHVYNFGNFKGFAAELDNATLNIIKALPNVEYIEKDAIIKAWDDETLLVEAKATLNRKAYVTQGSSTWGLGRLSHVNKGTSSYTYDDSAGDGTCSYVIDTGIFTTHPEFEGRATFLANYAGDGKNTDGNGHGTHVAGTIGSKTYGVAKKTKLYAVKVLDASGSGTNSGVIAGINFVASDSKTRSCPNGAVANMSLGGSKSTAVNSATAGVVSAGVFMAVAAGNDGANAANYSPASEPTAYTVGATDSNDAKASFSNYGTIVDVFAPGVAILSTWNNGGTNSISGTSMATPHVAGLGAYLLGLEGKKTPAALGSRITALATKNKITGLPSGTVNALIFNGNPSG